MDVIYPRCAGLDVHKQTVVACVRIAGDGVPLLVDETEVPARAAEQAPRLHALL